MRAVAVFPLMPRSRIIRVHIARHFQSDTQDLLLLLVETLFVFREDAVDLACRNINTPIREHVANQWLGHGSLMVQGKNRCIDGAVEMPSLQCRHLFGKWRYDRGAIGSDPALPTVKDVARFDDQLLNHIVLISLECASMRNVLNAEIDDIEVRDFLRLASLGRPGALPWLTLLLLIFPCALLKLRWFDFRPWLLSFQDRNLVFEPKDLLVLPGDELQEHQHERGALIVGNVGKLWKWSHANHTSRKNRLCPELSFVTLKFFWGSLELLLARSY